MSRDKLIHMTNQIAQFMRSKPAAEGIAGFAEHLNSYWEPRMRSQFFALIDRDPTDFDPLVLQAVGAVRRPETV
jgi:formate dehydrogenase subunit delta